MGLELSVDDDARKAWGKTHDIGERAVFAHVSHERGDDRHPTESKRKKKEGRKEGRCMIS